MIQEAKEIHEAQSQANQNEDDSVSTVLHPTEEKLNRNISFHNLMFVF